MDTPRKIASRNPATGELLREFEATSLERVGAAFERAKAAQTLWSAQSPKKRAAHLLGLRETLLNHVDELAEILSLENGKPKTEALTNELLPAIDMLTYFSRRAPRLLRDKSLRLHLLRHRQSTLNYWPLGVVAVISPWNYPFLLPFADILLALVAGNAVIFKPSEHTSWVGLKIQELVDKAGFPKHLLQTLLGDGTLGAEIIAQRPAKVFFTGSAATGKKVMSAAAENLIPVNLELGGKSPMIVLPDANLDYATSAALWGAFSNAGQVCASIERILLHEDIADRFLGLFKEKIARLRQGPSQATSNDLGPITFEKQKEVYEAHLADARQKDATFLAGGELSPDRRFMQPTVITGPNTERLVAYHEETFGPIVTVTTYRSVAEAIEKANDNCYGLTACVITRDLRLGETVARQLEAGTVMINEVIYTAGLGETPWGGLKNSGFGRTHSEIGLLEFVNVRHIHKPRSRVFTFKSPWWFPYTEEQYAFFRQLIKLYRGHWTDKLRALPLTIWSLARFLKRDKRLKKSQNQSRF